MLPTVVRWRRIFSRVFLVSVLVFVLMPSTGRAADPDFDIPNGHFYTQANGQSGAGGAGFAITDDGGIRFWWEFQRLGGVSVLGYPISHRFVWDGFTVQATQRVVMQWRPEVGQVYFVNVFDRMHDLGLDAALDAYRQIPPIFDNSPDRGLSWDQVVARHLEFLDVNEAIKSAYFADSDPVQHFGLPVSYRDYGNVFVVRAQWAVFQQWKEDVPWASKGQITIALGGDIAKEYAVLMGTAVTPANPPGAPGVHRTDPMLAQIQALSPVERFMLKRLYNGPTREAYWTTWAVPGTAPYPMQMIGQAAQRLRDLNLVVRMPCPPSACLALAPGVKEALATYEAISGPIPYSPPPG